MLVIIATAQEYRAGQWAQERRYFTTRHKRRRALSWALRKIEKLAPGYREYTARIIETPVFLR